MDRIYKHASKVATWLGREQEDDAKALRYLKEIYANGGLPKHSQYTCVNNFNPIANQEWYKRYRSMWKPISRLCSRVYWTRTWNIQEVQFAADAALYYGNDAIDWEVFIGVSYSAINIDYNGDTEEEDIQHQLLASHAVRLWGQKTQDVIRNWDGSDPLLLLFKRHHGAQCIDLRDKVFGIHSLAKDCRKNAVPVDYTKPFHLLCISLLNHSIPHQGTIGEKAMLDGMRAVIKLLLENGANLESKDNSGLTPLSLAALFGHEAVVKLLLENGANC
jgi:hypothetical protein